MYVLLVKELTMRTFFRNMVCGKNKLLESERKIVGGAKVLHSLDKTRLMAGPSKT